MPHNNIHPTTTDEFLFSKLRAFHAYPSEDGTKLFSMTVPQDHQPIFIAADRMQVTASLQEINMAAWMMAQRSGTDIDPIIEAAAILQPHLDGARVRYDPVTRHVSWALHFDDRLPLALSCSLPDWMRFKARTDAVCGIVNAVCGIAGRLCLALMIIF